MSRAARNVIALVGRTLLSLIFLMSGAGKILEWSGTVTQMSNHGVPAPSLLLAGALVLELGGAVLVILGWKTRWGAAALIAFLVPVTLVFHNFWAFDGDACRAQLINFLKNAALAGGLLLILAHGPGPISVDREP